MGKNVPTRIAIDTGLWRTGVAAFAAVGIFTSIWLWIFPWVLEEKLDNRGFRSEGGFDYLYHLQNLVWVTPADQESDPYGSRLQLYEDGRELGPSHSIHRDIRGKGAGRFSHWNEGLHVSASDNSNPATNGRQYAIHYRLWPPLSLVFACGIILACGLFGFRPVARVSVAIVIGLLAVGAPVEWFLRTEFSKTTVFGAFGYLPPSLQYSPNSKGYRDREHEFGRQVGRVRILLLGDSFTVGSGIANNETYPSRLSALAGSDVEVIVMAKAGWSTADELNALRLEGLKYAPDIVVVGAVTNDPSPPAWQPSGQSPEGVWFRKLSADLVLFRLLDYRLNRLADRFGWRYTYEEWERDLYDYAKPYRQVWERAVQDLSRVLSSNGIPGYAFVLIGSNVPGTDIQDEKYDTLAQVFGQAGFHTTNLRHAFAKQFRGVDGRSLWALPDDGHPNARVNEFFAEEIWETIAPHIERLRGAPTFQIQPQGWVVR